MYILGIETSCDDTAAAVLTDENKVVANVLSSQVSFHAKYGGIVPEIASRKHLELISPVCKEALHVANIGFSDIGLICVTRGPGLIGSLLVGVEYAKSLSLSLQIPIKGMNHMEGHLLSPLLVQQIQYPSIGLIVSGGHTEFIFIPAPGCYQKISSTVDDACEESLDKFGKMIGIPYPAGPKIEKIALQGDSTAIEFPIPSVRNRPLDMSFSGLKTAALNCIRRYDKDSLEAVKKDLCASYQFALFRHICKTAKKVLKNYPAKTLLLSGGVSANNTLHKMLQDAVSIPVIKPSLKISTDNAAMIAFAGYLRYMAEGSDDLSFEVESSLPLVSYKTKK